MATVGILCGAVRAQEMGELPAMDYDMVDAGPPVIEQGGGDFFSQDLGTLFRVRYNTESYGQDDHGNLDLGTMRVTNFDDAIGFFDGQLTLNDVQGVGFNIGVGFRWLNWMPFLPEPERVTGFSLWADGTSTEGGNFFPQVGVSYESLGEMWDMRVNSYIPIGKETQIGAFEPTGAIGFQGNFLSQITAADSFSALNVGEVEFARRLAPDRDAWAFATPYVLANDDADTAGAKVGVRGYAYPDLLLQFAVSDDDIFATNATFSMMWFVGRTRTNFQPACGLPDRMREPVLRNDYVALTKDQVFSGIPLTDTNGDAFRFVHVFSDAAPGGDGTFERPFDQTDGPNGDGSLENDIILVWSDSQFNMNGTMELKNSQRVLGEGNDEIFTIDTQQEGVIEIPETRPGSRSFDRAIIIDALGDGAIQLADLNEVANLDFQGGDSAIFSPATGAGNPNLHDLMITGTTVNGIQFTPLTRTVGTQNTVAGNVTIDDVVFADNTGNEININSFTTTDTTLATTTLQETISISDVTSTGGTGRGIYLQNTHDNRTATILNYLNGSNGTASSGGGDVNSGVLVFEGNTTTGFKGNVTLTNIDIFENTGFALDFLDIDAEAAVTITANNGLTYDGGAGDAGGLSFRDFDGTFTGNSSTIVDGTRQGVFIGEDTVAMDDSDGTFTFANTFTIDTVDTADDEIAAFHIDGFTGTLTMNGTIDNDTGRSLLIENVSDNAVATFAGEITDNAILSSRGVLIRNNTVGQIIISVNLDVATNNISSIELLNNADADISINGEVTVDHDGTGSGFTATGGGMLTMIGTNNTIDHDGGGTALVIEDMEINTAGVRWQTIDATGGGVNGIVARNLTGGQVRIGTTGDMPPDAGTITGTTGTAVVIENVANMTITGMRINNTMAVAGVSVAKSDAEDSIVNLVDMEINDGTVGVDVTGTGGTGELDLTLEDVDINDSTVAGLRFTDVDEGDIVVNDTTINGNDAGAGAQGVLITDSDANFTFNANTTIEGFLGTDFHVDGGEGVITMSGDITENTAGNSIVIEDMTGGSVTFASGSAVNDDGAGIIVQNNNDATINFNGTYDLDTTTNTAVFLNNNDDSTISFNPGNTAGNFDIDTTTGEGFVATGGGTLNVTGTANTITSTAASGLRIQDMTIGAVDFESVNSTGGANGILLENNETGTVTVGDTGAAAGNGGTIANTTDAGVRVLNTNVVLNGVTVNNAGGAGENGVEILHTSTTAGMNANLNRLTVDNATANRNGVLIDGTTGTGTFNANVQNLDVDVTGNGLDVNDGVTLTAGGTNIIETDTGVGLSITDTTIAGAGANFQSVTVNAGATNGVVMENVTGGQVAITGVGTTANSGGALTTAGDAVMLTNVQNVDLRNLRIINSTAGNGITIEQDATATTTMDVTIDRLNLNAAFGDGINVLADSDAFNFAMRLTNSTIASNVTMDNTGAGQFGLLVENNTITASGTDDAFSLEFSDGATDGDVTIRGNNVFTANDGHALFVDSVGGTAKDIKILVEDGSFTDTIGTDIAAVFQSRGNTLMQLTAQGNDFASSAATRDFHAQSSGTAAARMRLNLGGDPTEPDDFNNAIGQGTFLVEQAGTSVYSIFERDDTLNDLRNNGPVDGVGTFQDLAVPPTLPTVP